jgi:predicted RNA methylase
MPQWRVRSMTRKRGACVARAMRSGRTATATAAKGSAVRDLLGASSICPNDRNYRATEHEEHRSRIAERGILREGRRQTSSAALGRASIAPRSRSYLDLVSRLPLRSQAPESNRRSSPRNAGRSPEPPKLPSTPSATQLAAIRETLRSGELVDDGVFDDVYPFHVRRVSRVHWTPVEAAFRAGRLLADRPGARILDIGSGVGKFCIVAAASSVAARVRGVEHRAHLAEIAERAAARIGVDVTFVRGTLADCDPHDVDGVYLFNPFAENLSSPDDHLDETVELSEARYVRDTAEAGDFLRAARVGTRVVTYCGFGGDLPVGYERLLREDRGGAIELWVKSAHADARADVHAKGDPRIGRATLHALRKRALATDARAPRERE